jgi:hypothetical protein
MERSSILAHRGFFLSESEKNSKEALTRAMSAGFGIETDLRDLNGNLVISHDPPIGSPPPPSFEWLLKLICSSPNTGRIALNIKADGLSQLIQSQIEAYAVDVNRFFVFDMSVPDSLSYFKGSVPFYTRMSDYEQEPALLDAANGVWVDNFSGSFPQIQRAQFLIELGIKVVVVSPELHRRDPAKLWNEISETEIYHSALFEICTDRPIEAANRFCIT